jgi:LacI family transcriptional regulator
MGKRVTIQDIADELGLSRNTVSKALNNAGGLADATRERIIQKAMEMGYKQFAFLSPNQMNNPAEMAATLSGTSNEVALLTTRFIDRDHFASLTLDALQNDLSRRGYVLNTHRVSKEDLEACKLPPTLRLESVAAIVCVEVFDRAYADMVCACELPTLFLDGPAKLDDYILRSDQLFMDNTAGIRRLIQHMLSQGVRRFGFVGDWAHCQSFLERYEAFRLALLHAGVPVDERHCIKANKIGRIQTALSSLDEMPELFVCANDFVAFDVQRALHKLGLSVPGDILLAGFDDSAASRNWIPSLTTVHIHTQSIAYSAMQLLITRLHDPDLDYRRVYARTDLILRESTERPWEASA